MKPPKTLGCSPPPPTPTLETVQLVLTVACIAMVTLFVFFQHYRRERAKLLWQTFILRKAFVCVNILTKTTATNLVKDLICLGHKVPVSCND